MRDRNLNVTPPRVNLWVEWLRYIVQSSDPDAGELGFLVSLWGMALSNNGLTPEQAALAEPYRLEAEAFIKEHYKTHDDRLPDDVTNVVYLDGRKGGE